MQDRVALVFKDCSPALPTSVYNVHKEHFFVMLELQVKRARQEDVYRDLVRIPEVWRKDCNGAVIPEGSVCKIKILKDNRTRTGYAIVRGVGDKSGRVIYVDERLRNFLGIKPGDSVKVVLKEAGLIGQVIWAWRASDPAYRVAARLAVLSFWDCWALFWESFR